MVRVGGLQYTIEPREKVGKRITDMRLKGQLIDANKTYKVAGWAGVSEASRDQVGEPIWDVVARHLREVKTIKSVKPNQPIIKGVS